MPRFDKWLCAFCSFLKFNFVETLRISRVLGEHKKAWRGGEGERVIKKGRRRK
jgi:hypothetical protein